MYDARKIAAEFIGIPYVHHGRTLAGLDCYGLIIRMFERRGIRLFDINEEYDEEWSWKGRNYFVENAYREWSPVAFAESWDVVTFRLKGEVVNHAGIVIGDGQFVQTIIKTGTIISRLSDLTWSKRVAGYYRYKNVD